MNIIILPTAKKDLRKLPEDTAGIILKKLHSIRDKPLSYIERLKGSHLWKLRVGDYRVIMMIDTGQSSINIIKIGHRRDIYKRL